MQGQFAAIASPLLSNAPAVEIFRPGWRQLRQLVVCHSTETRMSRRRSHNLLRVCLQWVEAEVSASQCQFPDQGSCT